MGLGGESLFMLEILFLKEYFNLGRMSFIVAIAFAWMNLGGVLNIFITPEVAADASFLRSFFVSGIISLICTFFIYCACLIDRNIDKKNELMSSRYEAEVHEEDYALIGSANQERNIQPNYLLP